MIITFIVIPVIWLACTHQSYLQWIQSIHPKDIMNIIHNIIHISSRVSLEIHLTQHLMSWHHDSMTLNIKTHDTEFRHTVQLVQSLVVSVQTSRTWQGVSAGGQKLYWIWYIHWFPDNFLSNLKGFQINVCLVFISLVTLYQFISCSLSTSLSLSPRLHMSPERDCHSVQSQGMYS